MASCNIIFWSLVVPSATYGSEIWHLNGNSISLLESFQIYAAKKIQRFYHRIPNACCLYALGWMRLERFIQVKKLLFVCSMLALEDGALSKTIFCKRAEVYYRNEPGQDPLHDFSAVRELLDTVSIFNLDDIVRSMVEQNRMFSKFEWKKKIWARAWDLEDVFWEVEFRTRKHLDIIRRISSSCMY